MAAPRPAICDRSLREVAERVRARTEARRCLDRDKPSQWAGEWTRPHLEGRSGMLPRPALHRFGGRRKVQAVQPVAVAREVVDRLVMKTELRRLRENLFIESTAVTEAEAALRSATKR